MLKKYSMLAFAALYQKMCHKTVHIKWLKILTTKRRNAVFQFKVLKKIKSKNYSIYRPNEFVLQLPENSSNETANETIE